MKIKEGYKIREIAGENVLIMQGRYGMDMTKVITLNETSVFLWNKLLDINFEITDVVNVLIEQYDVSSEIAEKDVEIWLNELKECNLIV